MGNITLKRWRTLCYVQAVLSLEAFSAPVLIMFYTSYAGFTFEQYSAIIALIFVFLWMLEIPAGALADKYGRKRALIAGNGVYLSAMVCLVMQGHSVPGWLIALLFAFGGSLSSGTFQSMMFDAYASAGRSEDFHTVNARATSISLISGAGAAILGGAMAVHSLAFPMYADIGILALLTIIFCFLLQEPRIARSSRSSSRPRLSSIVRQGLSEIFSSKELFSGIVIVAFVFSCLRAGFNFYQPLLQASGVDYAAMGWLFAGFACLSSLTAYAFSHMSKSVLSSNFPWVVFVALFAVSAITMMIPGEAVSTGSVLVAIICHQIVRGIHPSYSTYLINLSIPVGSESRTTTLSAASLVRALFCAAFVWLSGLLSDVTNFANGFSFLSGGTALLIFVIAFLKAKRHRHEISSVPPAGN